MAEFDIDKKLLDKLTKTFKEADLTDLEFTWGDRSVRMRKKAPQVIASAAPAGAMQAAPAAAPAAPATSDAAAAASDAVDEANAVSSPMVGTAYLSSEPGKPPFISVGDKVSVGQTLLIIEAMKVMNPLESPKAGRVASILVGDSEPVEFGQPLVVIE